MIQLHIFIAIQKERSGSVVIRYVNQVISPDVTLLIARRPEQRVIELLY